MAILKTSTGQKVVVASDSDLYKQYMDSGAQEMGMTDYFDARKSGKTNLQAIADFNPNKSSYQPGSPISLSDLTNPQKLTTFNPVQENQPYDISKLDFQPMEMTGSEKKAQGMSDSLADLNKLLIGESAFRTEQEKAYGMEGLIKTQNDLTNQLNTLKADSQAIPLALQNESAGRGRTAAGIAPIQTGRLRQNAIQALGTSAMLQASQGNIATATTLIDRAVAQEFDPIREQISVTEKNLKLILESPAYSLEDKNRANQQLAIQEQKKQALEAQQAARKAIMTTASEAAKYGASAEELMAITSAETEEEAMIMALPYLSTEYQNEQAKIAREQDQQDFENSLALGEFGLKEDEFGLQKDEFELKKEQMKADLEQRAFENGVTLEELQLRRDEFATDSEFKNAQLYLDQLKAEGATGEIKYQKVNGVDYQVNPDGSLSLPATPQATPQDKIDKSTQVLDAVNAIQSLDWGKAVGAINSKVPRWAWSGERANIEAKVAQLRSMLTLDNMGIMKGVLSDRDMQVIQAASTSLNTATDEASFDKELKKIKNAAISIKNSDKLAIGQKIDNGDGTYSYKNMDGTTRTGEIGDGYIDKTRPKDDLGFSRVGSDTQKATLSKLSQKKDNQKGGQCGRFVNQLTGLGVGDSYQSKMAKMDKSIKYPEPGMVFVMPYKNTGHIGFIVGIKGDKAIVKDSNWKLDEKVRTHEIALNKMTGFARA